MQHLIVYEKNIILILHDFVLILHLNIVCIDHQLDWIRDRVLEASEIDMEGVFF